MEIRGRGEKKESKCSVCHISSFKCYKSFVCCYNKQRWAQLCQTLGGVPPWIDAVGKIDSKHQSRETATRALLQRQFACPLTRWRYPESRNNPSPGPANQAVRKLPKGYRCSLATSSEGACVGAEWQLEQPPACSRRHEGCNWESTREMQKRYTQLRWALGPGALFK